MSDYVLLFMTTMLGFFAGYQRGRAKIAELKKANMEYKADAEMYHGFWQSELRHQHSMQTRIDHEMSLRAKAEEDHQREIDLLKKQLTDQKVETATYKAKWCDEVVKREMDMRTFEQRGLTKR